METVFCPTKLVTGQIFQIATDEGLRRDNLVYGMFGTPKTFSWMLYSQLSNFIAKAAFRGTLPKEYWFPKLIYFTI